MIEPSMNKFFKAVSSIDTEREKFKLKENINKEQATKLYKEFYDEFNEYKKKVNDVFKNQEGFKPYEIIPLNEDNLFLVGDPYKMTTDKDIKEKDVDEVMLKLLKQFKTTETGATLKDLEDAVDKLTKKKELKEEVIKVLEDKILKPFETPAKDLEQYKKEKEEKEKEEEEKEKEKEKEEKEEKDEFDFEVDIPEIVEEDDKFDFEVDVPNINEEQEDDFNFSVDIPE